jgi:hypothetical protein
MTVTIDALVKQRSLRDSHRGKRKVAGEKQYMLRVGTGRKTASSSLAVVIVVIVDSSPGEPHGASMRGELRAKVASEGGTNGETWEGGVIKGWFYRRRGY